jgi:tRNA acetyltransferase TAN1
MIRPEDPLLGGPPARPQGRLEDCNLLVSFPWRAPGRARREVRSRLRALGDPAPITVPTLSNGLVAARTALDPRGVVRELRALYQVSPQLLRHTSRWVPVDVWTLPDLVVMREAVVHLARRIAPQETWRVTVEKRAGAALGREDVIRAVAPLVPAAVNLVHPDKILLVELFGDRVALAVLAPHEILSLATVPVTRAPSDAPLGTGDEPA